jgi:hypothetical protein
VQRPQANVIVGADGHTNVPSPKVPGKGDKTALQTVVDLAIGKLDLRDGSVTFADRKTPLNIRGENLRDELGFNLVTSRYTGEVDVSPLLVNNLRLDVKLPLTLEKDRVGFTNAILHTSKSQIMITGASEHLVSPRTHIHVVAGLDPFEELPDDPCQHAASGQLTRWGLDQLRKGAENSVADGSF